MLVPNFTRSSGIGPLPAVLEAYGGPRLVARVFQASDLPFSVASGDLNWLPLRSLLSLFEHAAAAVGDDLLGLRVGQSMLPEDFGMWARYSMTTPDLKGVIGRLNRSVGYHQSGGQFDLEIAGNLAIWSYRVIDGDARGRRHHADHALWPMLTVIRRFADAGWAPVRVECSYDRPDCARRLEEIFGAPIFFGRPANAIGFDRMLLDAPSRYKIHLDQCVTFGDLRRLVMQRPPVTVLDAARAIVRTRLGDSQTDIEGTARLLGIGARTLQRHLGEHNVTFRALLDQVRTERALELMQDTGNSITEIAFAIGYEDPTSFSRAFRRLTGRSPGQMKRK